jgi:hypothetical protein
MANNSLWPAFGIVDYSSAYGNHKMTIPTRAWNAGIGTNGFGGYLGWDLSTANDAQDMWTDLITDIAAFAPATLTFNNATIYTMASSISPRIPVTQIPLNIAGTSAATTQAKAAQSTWNFRTTTFGIFKLVLLDSPVGTGFNKTLAGSFGAPDLAVIGGLTDQAKAWSGRDGSPPANCHSKTYTLNEKLRREYGMG